MEYGLTKQANIELTVNNLGIIGNGFRGKYSSDSWGSCEYPAKSGIEHLFNGGLWVGGIINGQKLVSTGAISSSQGYSTGAKGYELTAELGATLQQKSKLVDNEFYAIDAVSHQDLIGNCTDKNILVPGSNQQIADHKIPLNLDIHFEAYNWNFSSANYFVPLKFDIKNTGTKTIDSVWVGYWANFVIRDVNINIPGGTPFYSSGGNAYVDSLSLSYQWDAENITYNTQSYVGLKFLGATDQRGNFQHPKSNPTFKTNYNTWLFSSGSAQFFRPENDNEYYLKLSGGLEDRSDWISSQSLMKNKGNRSVLISVGPFGSLAPGETISVTYGIVCAASVRDGNPPQNNTSKQIADFIRNSNSLQRSFNGEDANFNGKLDENEDNDKDGKISRWIFPEPPAIPQTKIIASDNNIDVYWSDNSIKFVDPVSKIKDFEGFRIYKTQVGFDMQDEKNIEKNLTLVASFDAKGNQKFFDNGFDSIRLAQPITFQGDTIIYTHKYSFKNIVNGWQHAISLTAFDTGNDTLSLASLESSLLQNLKRVYAGKPANNSIKTEGPFVYPNPYYGLAAWEGSSKFEEDRKLIFSNLPEKCKVKIFTYSGDLIDEFEHNSNYNGSDVRWFNTYSDIKQTVFSGGEHAWDLMSANSQLIARGIYMFSVEDLKNGNTNAGKFVIIK
ncbi:MAG: hypothetical protein SFY32_02505 [Bacteroidota bacterium]|nr:hypothetical protein [Bacteroidota bacterium]